jgi:hypothetical protein
VRFVTLGVCALTVGATLLAASPAEAQRQPPTPEQLQERFDEKMGEAWWKNATWHTDYATALEAAKTSGKKIFAYFTRSYLP